MARDAITVSLLAKHTANTTPAGTAINPTNGGNITGIGKARNLTVRVTNTITNAGKTVTFKAGANPPSQLAPLGDLVLTVPQSGDIMVALEHARFAQADGTYNVDYQSGMTGQISAIENAANI